MDERKWLKGRDKGQTKSPDDLKEQIESDIKHGTGDAKPFAEATQLQNHINYAVALNKAMLKAVIQIDSAVLAMQAAEQESVAKNREFRARISDEEATARAQAYAQEQQAQLNKIIAMMVAFAQWQLEYDRQIAMMNQLLAELRARIEQLQQAIRTSVHTLFEQVAKEVTYVGKASVEVDKSDLKDKNGPTKIDIEFAASDLANYFKEHLAERLINPEHGKLGIKGNQEILANEWMQTRLQAAFRIVLNSQAAVDKHVAKEMGNVNGVCHNIKNDALLEVQARQEVKEAFHEVKQELANLNEVRNHFAESQREINLLRQRRSEEGLIPQDKPIANRSTMFAEKQEIASSKTVSKHDESDPRKSEDDAVLQELLELSKSNELQAPELKKQSTEEVSTSVHRKVSMRDMFEDDKGQDQKESQDQENTRRGPGIGR